MDVTLPAKRDRGSTPVVIMIHGGSWVTGSKADFYGLGLDTFFAANNCALVNINYRLTSNYPYPDAIEDIGLVMDFIKKNAYTWQVNGDRVCLFGRSSGSHLALLYSYADNGDKRIKVVIDGFGPTDFTDSTLLYTPLGNNVAFMLGPYAENPKLWHDASPIFYMQTALPTVIFQGTADQLVYPKQSLMLQDSLLAHSFPCLYIPWVGNGHGWDQAKWLKCKDTTLKWIKNYL